MQEDTKIYGGIVVRLSDRMMLCKAPGCPTNDFSIPGTVWAEVVSKCSAPNFRTSSFISLNSGGNNNINNNNNSPSALDISTAAEAGPTQLSYHIMSDNEVAFAILAGKGLTRRQSHTALDEAAKTFHKMFVENVSKLNTKAVDVFVRPYRDLLLRVSENNNNNNNGTESEDKVRKVKKAVAEVKDLALDNVERVIQRGQRIDDIVQSTEDLQFQAQGFQRSSRDLHQQLWWNAMKGKLMIGGVAGAFILVVMFVFFTGNGEKE